MLVDRVCGMDLAPRPATKDDRVMGRGGKTDLALRLQGLQSAGRVQVLAEVVMGHGRGFLTVTSRRATVH